MVRQIKNLYYYVLGNSYMTIKNSGKAEPTGCVYFPHKWWDPGHAHVCDTSNATPLEFECTWSSHITWSGHIVIYGIAMLKGKLIDQMIDRTQILQQVNTAYIRSLSFYTNTHPLTSTITYRQNNNQLSMQIYYICSSLILLPTDKHNHKGQWKFSRGAHHYRFPSTWFQNLRFIPMIPVY